MFDRSNQHVQLNSILVPKQFGFRRGITVQQVIFTLRATILNALNQWRQVGGIYCDL
jgi:hypothetical protein